MSSDFVEVENGRLYYEVEGEGPQTIVWMHGLPLNGRSWSAQVGAFRDDFRNVTFDLRGYGKSTPLPEDATDLSGLYVSDLKRLFAHLGLERPALVAHASGAHGALRFAADEPEALSKLVTINGSPKFRTGAGWPYGFDQKSVDAFLEIIEADDLDGIAAALLDRALQDPAPPGALDLLRALYVQMTREASKETIRAFFTKIALDDHRDRLKCIRVPTLILCSALGVEVPPPVAVYMREQIPSAQLVELPGTDHFAFATQATLVNRLIRQFLAPCADVDALPTRLEEAG